MRCDVNLSVRRVGETRLSTRTEMKNLNSVAYTAKAIEYEFRRQVETVCAGGAVAQETRRFDPASGKTFTMRSKENADDYRYFPDPDLPPVHLTDAKIDALSARLPELPDARRARYMRAYGLSAYEAGTLVASLPLSAAFDAAVADVAEPQRLWSLLLGEVARMQPDDDAAVGFAPDVLAALSNLISEGTIHFGAARRVLLAVTETGRQPAEVVEALGLAQISDVAEMAETVDRVLDEHAKLVTTYLGGKESVLQALMGRVMAATQGRANPVLATELLNERLEKRRLP